MLHAKHKVQGDEAIGEWGFPSISIISEIRGREDDGSASEAVGSDQQITYFFS
jgi:hypothetical protein